MPRKACCFWYPSVFNKRAKTRLIPKANIRKAITSGKRELWQRTERRHYDDCDFEGWNTAVCIPIVDRHSNHRELVWTRAVHSVTFKRKTLHSVGQNVTRNSVWHPQYRRNGLGKPLPLVARWIDIYVAPYNPQLLRIESLQILGYSGVKRLYVS